MSIFSSNLSSLNITLPVSFSLKAVQEYYLSLGDGVYVLSRFSHVLLFVTLWTVARQAPLSMGFSRQESWSGLTCPPPGDLPDPGVKLTSLMSSVLEGSSLPLMPLGKPLGYGDEITNYEGGESNCQDCYLCWEMTSHFHLEGQPQCVSYSDQECIEQHFKPPLRVNRKERHDQVLIFPKLGRKRWSHLCQKLLLTGELAGPTVELTEGRMV